jgi:hypothetical protein
MFDPLAYAGLKEKAHVGDQPLWSFSSEIIPMKTKIHLDALRSQWHSMYAPEPWKVSSISLAFIGIALTYSY